MPGGAVAGRAEILDLIDFDARRRQGRPKVQHQGTFSGNPLSMATGLAALQELERISGCERANELGTLARKQLNEMAQAEGLPFTWYGEFSGFHMLFGAHEAPDEVSRLELEAFLARPQPLTNRFRMAMNVLGLDINTKCSGLVSAVHTEKDIDRLVCTAAQAGAWLRSEGLF
jgi:glutamate-1-semialdehyde 2,1-aminomutase